MKIVLTVAFLLMSFAQPAFSCNIFKGLGVLAVRATKVAIRTPGSVVKVMADTAMGIPLDLKLRLGGYRDGQG